MGRPRRDARRSGAAWHLPVRRKQALLRKPSPLCRHCCSSSEAPHSPALRRSAHIPLEELRLLGPACLVRRERLRATRQRKLIFFFDETPSTENSNTLSANCICCAATCA